MKLIDVAQRSDAWQAWRAQGITASETPVILGHSPYKTPWRLWAERTGLARTADLSNNNPHAAWQPARGCRSPVVRARL
ncbi:YqaJ viral recombinase family protein [Lamprobacter modestohalophilus]|nr:YqaJ viral recombinase family protein [Lamprobacter modestohalophilus]MEA1053321.1 YqaJ viral recombinase family protein [Lamprobacter modestohalophilus]